MCAMDSFCSSEFSVWSGSTLFATHSVLFEQHQHKKKIGLTCQSRHWQGNVKLWFQELLLGVKTFMSVQSYQALYFCPYCVDLFVIEKHRVWSDWMEAHVKLDQFWLHLSVIISVFTQVANSCTYNFTDAKWLCIHGSCLWGWVPALLEFLLNVNTTSGVSNVLYWPVAFGSCSNYAVYLSGTCHVYPNCLAILTPYISCHRISTAYWQFLVDVSITVELSCKQCWLWSDATWCNIWSGSTLTSSIPRVISVNLMGLFSYFQMAWQTNLSYQGKHQPVCYLQ